MQTSDRKQLDREILAAAQQVEYDISNVDWIDSAAYKHLTNLLYQLIRYYQVSGDVEINGQVIGEYVGFTRLLRNMLIDEQWTQEEEKKINNAIGDFESFIDEVIKEVERTAFNAPEQFDE